MGWPYNRRVESVHAWGILSFGAAVLVAVPGIYATQHTGYFRWWWPTDWMALPLGLSISGLLLLLVPVRQSATDMGDQNKRDKIETFLSPTESALDGLPRMTTTFTGRDAELEQLMALLDPAFGEAAPVQVSTVSGLGGIGKTELALQAAYAARQRGWFSGGVLFINLFGYDPDRRLAPGRALDSMLRRLGVPKERIPPSTQDRARLYESVLAAHAARRQPILVLIDNAGSAEQAELLLPPVGAGRAIITSRHVLAQLGARLIQLKPLSPEDAAALLGRKLYQANGPDDHRAEDAAAARDLGALCGGLPLALQLAGANLAADRSKSLRQMADDMKERETRLDEMNFGDRTVRATFDLSYQALPAEEQRLFRLLTLNLGPDISLDAAASVAGLDRRQTRRQLEALGSAHLVERRGSDRWQMHDLVRLFAESVGRENSDADQRAAAEDRLLRYYKIATRAAIDLLFGNPTPKMQFHDPEDSISWLKAEHTNLTSAVVGAADSHPEIVMEIAVPFSVFLSEWRFSDEVIIVDENALKVARALRSVPGEAVALGNLGIALERAGQAQESLLVTIESVALYRGLAQEDPDRYEPGLGRALANLAARAAAGNEDRLAAAQEAVDIGRRWAREVDTSDNRVELAGAFDNLGMALSNLGQHSAAIPHIQEAVDIRRSQAERAPSRYEPFLGEVLMDFAIVQSRTGCSSEAVATAKEGIAIFRRLAADDPTARTPDLIEALNQYEDILSAIGRSAEAKVVADDAAKVQHLIIAQPERSSGRFGA